MCKQQRSFWKRDKTIQVLKKNLKVPNTQHVQSSELIAVQEKMMEYKGKLLKMQEEKKKWETEKADLITQVTRLNKGQNEEKEVMEELMNQPFIDTEEPLVNIEEPVNEFSVDALLVPMSQVSLKEVEIKELKNENENIKLELAKSIEEKNKFWNENSLLKKKSMN